MRTPNPFATTTSCVSPRQALQTALVRGALIGVCTGALIGLFRLSHERASKLVATFVPNWDAGGMVVTAQVGLWVCALIVLARVLGTLVRSEPLTSGSGIPQTELTLAGKLPLPWLRIVLFKYAGSWLALVAGLSLGREGPSIQIGGALGRGLEEVWTSPQEASALTHNPHIIAGAIAGLASAFGAPLAGVLFAFEEMKCRLSVPLLLFACASALGAQGVTRFVLGLGDILPFPVVTPPRWGDFWMLALFGVVLGWLGTLYNRVLLALKDMEARQTWFPDQWRMLPPLFCAGLATLFVPRILGGGEALILELGSGGGFTLRALVVLLILKVLYSILSVTARIPGGLLMPILCVGALIGSLWAHTGLMTSSAHGDAGQVAAYILFGMAGFFAGTVRAPLTGIALVTEMSGAINGLPGSLVVGVVACLTANFLHCPPVYDSLKARIPPQARL